MSVFYLVRHGLTQDTGRRLSGWSEGVHLSSQGQRQAEALAEALSVVPLKAVYSSPLERTMETARPIASRQKLRVRVRPGIGEVDFGAWTNRPFAQLKRTRLWARVQQAPSSVRFPGGESFLETQARALNELERIGRDHEGEAVCVVSHGDVIRVLAAHFLGLHLDLFQRIVISPGSTTTIALYSDGPKVISLNTVPPL